MNSFGFHFAWQPGRVPVNLRSEYARSRFGKRLLDRGSLPAAPGALLAEGDVPKTEVVGRGQQLFAGVVDEDDAEEYGIPDVDTRQGDFGLNYYLKDGLKASASYGRRFNSDGNVNLWTVGLAYRFAIPLGKTR